MGGDEEMQRGIEEKQVIEENVTYIIWLPKGQNTIK